MMWFSSDPSAVIPSASPSSKSEHTFSPNMDERSDYYGESYEDPFELHIGDDGRNLFHRRSGRFAQREVNDMDGLANVISMLDYILDSPRKRHITGGILLSVSMLFGSLALTVITMKNDEVIIEEEREDE